MQAKPNRFRPRFSIRMLAIIVTLVCCYAACWGPTRKQGFEDVQNFEIDNFGMTTTTDECSSLFPLIVCIGGIAPGDDPFGDFTPRNRYYFWFFGFVAKLPYEREVEYDPGPT